MSLRSLKYTESGVAQFQCMSCGEYHELDELIMLDLEHAVCRDSKICLQTAALDLAIELAQTKYNIIEAVMR